MVRPRRRLSASARTRGGEGARAGSEGKEGGKEGGKNKLRVRALDPHGRNSHSRGRGDLALR
jgi:hypothetical protein